MAEITTTQAFSDGDTVTATKLNNITANAAIQTEAITNRSAETTVDQANDLLLMYDASATALKKVTLSNVIKAGTASNFPVTGNATIGGTLGVTGASTLSDTISATKASGTGLAVTSNATIGGTLGVTGASTLANTAVLGTLGVSDTISATKSTGTGLAVTNNATVGGTLAVTGAITASSTVNGTTIPTSKTLVTTDDTQTLTGKTVNLASNTLAGTLAQFNTSCSNADFASLAGAETLTNKTLTSPVISSISNTGTLTLPTSTDTLVGRATTDTLTNKTLTNPIINTGTISGGTINNAVIGGTTAAAGSFTTVNASGLITASGGVSGNVTGNVTGSSGSCTGNSATATTLQTGRTISLTGDATGTSASFNGSANASIATTLTNSGVAAGTYGGASQIPSITVDAKGRITSASNNSFSTTPSDGSITYAKLSTSATEADNVAKRTAKAWVNFNGTGTPAIRDDFNVSSITDNGTGDYAINFTSAMPDVNYCIVTNAGVDSTYFQAIPSGARTISTGSCRIMTNGYGSSKVDMPNTMAAVFSS